MLLLAILGTSALAFVNTFGAWVTQNRRRWLAALFMLAAVLLAVAAVTLAYRLDFSVWLLTAGLTMTWLSSLLHARLVTRHFVWPNHLFRAVVAGAILVLALSGLGQ